MENQLGAFNDNCLNLVTDQGFCPIQSSWFESSKDIALASLPLLGVATIVTGLAGAAFLGFGKIYNHLSQDQKHWIPDLRFQRQQLANDTAELSREMITAGFAATMVTIVATATKVLSVGAGGALASGVVLATVAAVVLNNVIHQYMAKHDGRHMSFSKLFS